MGKVLLILALTINEHREFQDCLIKKAYLEEKKNSFKKEKLGRSD